jgi:hypothetical protein
MECWPITGCRCKDSSFRHLTCSTCAVIHCNYVNPLQERLVFSSGSVMLKCRGKSSIPGFKKFSSGSRGMGFYSDRITAI